MNGTFEELFKVYVCFNKEMTMIARQFYEFGRQIAEEPSAALTAGMDLHALRRQREFLDYANAMITALNSKPIPDLAFTHPVNFAIDMSTPYRMFLETTSVGEVPLNEQTKLLAQHWMTTAAELASSQSAKMAGSMYLKDYERCINNLAVIAKFVDEMEARPQLLDLPELTFADVELKGTMTPGKK